MLSCELRAGDVAMNKTTTAPAHMELTPETETDSVITQFFCYHFHRYYKKEVQDAVSNYKEENQTWSVGLGRPKR